MNTATVAQLAGVTLRQLQWWDEEGACSVRRNGHGRQYSETDAVLACCVARLRQGGLPLQRVRHILPKLRDGLTVIPERNFAWTDGERVRWAVDERELLAAIARSKRPVVVVPVADIRNRVRRADGERIEQ